ncbi:MAG: nitroreductase family protein [Firmicutes bacterium]|nr:nitroreductase family protein [Bacillota bacterium]
MNETLKVIKSRRSIRQFTEKQLREEDLQAILEAALFAPSAGNAQPWHFTVIQNKTIIDELAQAAKAVIAASGRSPYQEMAQREDFHVFYHAPTIIIVSGNPKAGFIHADCAAAAQNILLAAEALGLGSCWIGLVMMLLQGEQKEKWCSRLEIPQGYEPVHCLALGYKAQTDIPVPARKKDCINYLR